MKLSRIAAAGALLMALAAVPIAAPAAAQSTPGGAETRLPVVASFSILGDLVKNVGGDRVAVSTLVGADGDAHVFQPAPADAKKVAAAKVVFVNGLGFEGWMDRLVKSSGTKATMMVVSKGVEAREMEEEGHAHEAGKEAHAGHDHEETDPHAWQSVGNAEIYVANIRDGLIAADPDGKATYEANASAYLEKLKALDTEIKAAVARIPADKRRVITSHDAFGYYGAAYGLEFIAPQGVSTEAEASAKDVARIIRQIKAEKIPAVFLENISDPRLIKRIADETGAKIGGTVFSDALSDDKGPAATYIDMMQNNIREFSAALSS
ncbi:metal ABC transporter substrate-binding protein [Ancylobacter defluvii]|uniref:Metal ABC transporter substrate-binding protein n=1 Tax=Ancylobacter defluvii TaxID=1282440 RepID=A0A9W6JRP4_9HYPH|nr:metal ABC transporter substrate-binding protein [Ancylobacter defluvii]MBS7587367.1 metal ABC transporter substrate-binding protein [Ancylobacter defluvii]GLK82057.1 metal ABC transporter substrate-binding protein [Ancylobacter defluvii]